MVSLERQLKDGRRQCTHSFGLRYKFSTSRCWKKLVSPTRLYARCASSPMTMTSYSRLLASSFISFSLPEVSHYCSIPSTYQSLTHIKLIPTMPNPTTTIFFRAPPCGSFSEPFTPSGPPSIGPALISCTGICGCQLLDIIRGHCL